MDHDVTTACAQPAPPAVLAGQPSADAIAVLGDALAAFSSRVARRELELSRLFDEIARERSSLLDTVLNRLFEGFSGVIPFETLECAFLSDCGRRLVGAWRRGHAATLQPNWSISIEGPLHDCLRRGEPAIISDLHAERASDARSAIERHLLLAGVRAALACPLVADGVPLGLLFFTSGQPDVFRPAHETAFLRAAAQVSAVVYRTRAYGEFLGGHRALESEARRLRRVATTDALTGVLNRRALDSRLERAWARFEQDGTGFGLIFCDLDHFKQVNDTHGHAAGDRVLAQAARSLARGLRGADAVGRYGGEEFLAIVDTGVEDTLGRVAQRLRRLLAEATAGAVPVTASFGVASSHRFPTRELLVTSADRALYDAKRRGRDCCVLGVSSADLVLLQNGD